MEENFLLAQIGFIPFINWECFKNTNLYISQYSLQQLFKNSETRKQFLVNVYNKIELLKDDIEIQLLPTIHASSDYMPEMFKPKEKDNLITCFTFESNGGQLTEQEINSGILRRDSFTINLLYQKEVYRLWYINYDHEKETLPYLFFEYEDLCMQFLDQYNANLHYLILVNYPLNFVQSDPQTLSFGFIYNKDHPFLVSHQKVKGMQWQSEKCSLMMISLQDLIAEKEKKAVQLNSSSFHKAGQFFNKISSIMEQNILMIYQKAFNIRKAFMYLLALNWQKENGINKNIQEKTEKRIQIVEQAIELIKQMQDLSIYKAFEDNMDITLEEKEYDLLKKFESFNNQTLDFYEFKLLTECFQFILDLIPYDLSKLLKETFK